MRATQSQEVSSWGRTELYDLLDIIQPLQLGSHSLNLVALSLLHTLQSKDTALYVLRARWPDWPQ